MNKSIRRTIEAYGGRETWQKAKQIHATFSAGGLAFKLKNRTPFESAKITLDVHEPNCSITPIGSNKELSGVLHNRDTLLVDPENHVIDERIDARHYFSKWRRNFIWDDLDMSYFANYAMWNYLALPALLLREDIDWKELEPGYFRANFPEHIPTHSRTQYFRFNLETGLLLQHDYTADVIGPFARASNVVLDHQEQNGVKFASHRRVTPRTPWGKPLFGPTLIEIKIHSFSLE